MEEEEETMMTSSLRTLLVCASRARPRRECGPHSPVGHHLCTAVPRAHCPGHTLLH